MIWPSGDSSVPGGPAECLHRPGSPVGSTGTFDAMAARPQVSVEPRPDGRWAVQRDGTQRASKLFDRKTDAVDRARTQAKREGAELVVKDQQGRIQSKDSHGRDDPRKPG